MRSSLGKTPQLNPLICRTRNMDSHPFGKRMEKYTLIAIYCSVLVHKYTCFFLIFNLLRILIELFFVVSIFKR